MKAVETALGILLTSVSVAFGLKTGTWTGDTRCVAGVPVPNVPVAMPSLTLLGRH